MPDQLTPSEAEQAEDLAHQCAARRHLQYGGICVECLITALTKREAACWEEAIELAGLCSCGHCQLTVREFRHRTTLRREG